MSSGSSIVIAQCIPIRELFSSTNIKSMLRGFIYVYDTSRNITTRPIQLAIPCRLIQLFIIFLFIYGKGYQKTDTSIISSVDFKAKGIGSYTRKQNRPVVVDSDDFFITSPQTNYFFIMTNFIRTDQEYKQCPESPDVKGSICRNDSDCQLDKNSQRVNGQWTGRCIIRDTLPGQCELEGWCPVPSSAAPGPSDDSFDFTIWIKNIIEFRYFNIKKLNYRSMMHVDSCDYGSQKNRTCPVFRIGTIMNLIDSDMHEHELMLRLGGIIHLNIDWNCNFDKALDDCLPTYTFRRFDRSFEDRRDSTGFSHRTISYSKYDNRSFRTVIRAYGLQFFVSVTGTASRFDLITFIVNIAWMIVTLCITTFVFDTIALYLYRRSDVNNEDQLEEQVQPINHVDL